MNRIQASVQEVCTFVDVTLNVESTCQGENDGQSHGFGCNKEGRGQWRTNSDKWTVKGR